jgi:hypothetical protein
MSARGLRKRVERLEKIFPPHVEVAPTVPVPNSMGSDPHLDAAERMLFILQPPRTAEEKARFEELNARYPPDPNPLTFEESTERTRQMLIEEYQKKELEAQKRRR